MNPQQNYPLDANGKLPGVLVDAVADRVGRAPIGRPEERPSFDGLRDVRKDARLSTGYGARLQRFARNIPVFAGTGNFNSLFRRNNSLFVCVGNFRAAPSNRSSFSAVFSPIGAKIAGFPVFVPVGRELGRSREASEAFAHAAG